MSEMERIQDQLERAYRGEAWHGPSLLELLDGVSSDDAAQRPIEGAHTIAELVRHIVAWENEAVARLDGRGSDLPPAEDWPAGETSWPAHLDALAQAHERLLKAIGEVPESRLDEPVVGSPGTVYYLIHGVVQHNLYHAGQIAVLKKAL